MSLLSPLTCWDLVTESLPVMVCDTSTTLSNMSSVARVDMEDRLTEFACCSIEVADAVGETDLSMDVVDQLTAKSVIFAVATTGDGKAADSMFMESVSISVPLPETFASTDGYTIDCDLAESSGTKCTVLEIVITSITDSLSVREGVDETVAPMSLCDKTTSLL